jgi:phosphopantothenoylcysteine decarboxylase/phosphopantothenate--cysteine ligase
VRIVVTAGPTREPLDPVRFIGNRSSGKMGYAIVDAAIDAGHDVILISGPVCLAPPKIAELVSITTSDELLNAVTEHVKYCDVLIMCAAVADYKPATYSQEKSKKRRERFSLELVPTTDILAAIAKQPRNFFVVGFAAETSDVAENAKKKLRAKDCDMIVANDVSRSDSGMDADENEVTILVREGEMRHIAHAEKKIIARELMKIICDEVKKVLTNKS